MAKIVVSVPSRPYAEALDGLAVDVVEWTIDAPCGRTDLDMVVVPAYKPFSSLRHLEGNKPALVQLPSIGYDGVEHVIPKGFLVANAAGVHETATAELAVGAIIAVLRKLPDAVRNQGRRLWQRGDARGLADSTVLIVGAGGVANAIADRLAPFEVKVRRVGRSGRTDARGPVRAASELAELLPAADVVILAVPLTDATRRMADDAFLSRMRDGAVLVNVARGAVADTEALVRHADRLALVLDVTDPEPLPEGHPLWEKAALITPHAGGASAAFAPRIKALVRRQAERLIAGDRPENVVLRP